MSIEKGDSLNPIEGKKSTGIEDAESFDALYEAIRTIGEIQGTKKNYTPEQLVKVIERVRHGHRPLEFVTRSYGIRDSVERLLANDKVYQKYAKGSKAPKS